MSEWSCDHRMLGRINRSRLEPDGNPKCGSCFSFNNKWYWTGIWAHKTNVFLLKPQECYVCSPETRTDSRFYGLAGTRPTPDSGLHAFTWHDMKLIGLVMSSDLWLSVFLCHYSGELHTAKQSGQCKLVSYSVPISQSCWFTCVPCWIISLMHPALLQFKELQCMQLLAV